MTDAPALTNRPSAQELRTAVERMLATQINPLLKLHGGAASFVSVNDAGEVQLAFEGACKGCSLKSVTYALGIRQKLMPIPGVTEVSIEGVRLSRAALDRVEKYYAGYAPWVPRSVPDLG